MDEMLKSFLKTLVKLKKLFNYCFGYWIHPSASSLGKELGIKLIASYQR